MDDLVEVSDKDIMGEAPVDEPVEKKKRYRIIRPIRRVPPPTSLGGIR
jgi:hypothetical protein